MRSEETGETSQRGVAGVQVLGQGFCLKSIQRGGGLLRVLYTGGEVEVLIIEVGPKTAIEEPYLYGPMALHVVTEGEVIFEKKDGSYDLIRGEGIWVGDGQPYRLVNPGDRKGTLCAFLFKQE